MVENVSLNSNVAVKKTQQNNVTYSSNPQESKKDGSNLMLGTLACLATIGLGVLAFRSKGAKTVSQEISQQTQKISDDVSQEVQKIPSEVSEIAQESTEKTEPKLNDEAQKIYNNYQQYLNGKSTVVVNDKKSDILKKMGDYYHTEELNSNRAITKEISDSNNEHWLNEQHHIKEKEYSDFCNRELEKTKELQQKEIQVIQANIEEEKLKFIQENKNNLPSFEQRYNEILRDMRTSYGGSFTTNTKLAKYTAKNNDEYLEYAFEKSPKYKELALKLRLIEMEPDELQYYKEAEQVLISRKLNYDRLELASLPSSTIKSIAKNEFGTAKAIGHGLAYQVNGALRLDLNPEDIIITLLDESFKSAKPLTKSTVVYRAVTGGSADNSIDFINKLMNAKKGDTFVDKAYSFSSFKPGCAVSCNGIRDLGSPEIKLTIKVPKGAKISYGSAFEQCEMLFPRNAEFRIVEEAKVIKPGVEYIDSNGQKRKSGDYVEIVVEYVLPKA